MINIDKRVLNFLVIAILTTFTFWWTFLIFHLKFEWSIVFVIICMRILGSILIYKDYSLSWSKVTQKTFLIKSIVNIIVFLIYLPIFYQQIEIYFLASELFLYIFVINFLMYAYYNIINRTRVEKTKQVVIYGAGKAGLKLNEEFRHSTYSVKYFCDDDESLDGRSIDSIEILSLSRLKRLLPQGGYNLLVIAMPSADKKRVNEIYENLHSYFDEVQILPALDDILRDKDFVAQLKDISVEDLLARDPQDLDKDKISSFIKDKVVLITGAGGSIGSELVRQAIIFKAKKLILLDHSEYNLYQIEQEVSSEHIVPVLQSVVNIDDLDKTFKKHKPEIVLHAAAYKHVPLVEANVDEAIRNNILGTKNTIDIAIKYGVEKFVLISTDKAVRPTNVMGTTKRICELYAQNVVSLENVVSKENKNTTEIVAVRFGNVLGSSGSVIPKFKEQIEKGKNITVTHPDITRYFMLIPEACELVLQAGAIGKGGEIFILDMGEPIKIVDLAKKMIALSGRDDIDIEFIGLRAGEKLYEELLIDESDCKTDYDSITVAKPTYYDIKTLNKDIKELLNSSNKLKELKKIVPEFNHQLNL